MPSSKFLVVNFRLMSLLASLCLGVLASCQIKSEADSIIDKAIEAHGGDNLEEVDMSFDFRDKKYVVKRDDGRFQYERIFNDSIGAVRDILTNDGFTRIVNSDTVQLTDEYKRRYSNSVNSVIYFALLPFGLDGDAVNKKYLGETTIKNIPYFEILVSFEEEGGGEDHEDIYMYWINQQTFTMDYLAYAYHVEGGGTRFREAINAREMGGILFQDYINYDYKGDTTDLHRYETLFEEDKLVELSRILLENIEVED